MKNSTLISPVLYLLCLALTTGGCKKEKVYTVKGTLLFSNTIPTPVTNYPLELYQGGSPGAPIAIGVSSSSAHTVTDAQGHFSIKFTQGGGTFFGIPISNNNPVNFGNLFNTTSYPKMDIKNFPLQDNSYSDTVYLCKKVDTVIIQMNVSAQVTPTDSFTLYASNLQGFFQKVITGISVPANSAFAFDTITNATFCYFDFQTKAYSNACSITPAHRFGNFAEDSFPPLDEKKVILHYTLY